MRMVEGPTLKELIQRRQLDDRRALRLLTQVAEALDAAHATGADPSRRQASQRARRRRRSRLSGRLRADEGPRRRGDDRNGQFVGTIDYISPEQARGEHATARSDVYALTAVLCECLTGQVPYVRATEDRACSRHLSEPAPRLSEVRSDLPRRDGRGGRGGHGEGPGGATGVRRRADAEGAASARCRAGARAPASAEATRLRRQPARPRAHGAANDDPGATRLAATVARRRPDWPATAPPAGARARGSIPPPARPPASIRVPPARHRSSGTQAPGVGRAGRGACSRAPPDCLLGRGSSGSGEAFSDSASAGYARTLVPPTGSGSRAPPRSRAHALAAARAGGGSAASALRARQRSLAGEVNASGASLLPSVVHARPRRPTAPPRTGAARRRAGLPLPRAVRTRPRRAADAVRRADRERRGDRRVPERLRRRRDRAMRADRGDAEAERHDRVRAWRPAPSTPRAGAHLGTLQSAAAPAARVCAPPRAPPRRPAPPRRWPPPTARRRARSPVSASAQRCRALNASLAARWRRSPTTTARWPQPPAPAIKPPTRKPSSAVERDRARAQSALAALRQAGYDVSG